jgi:hypothetical protein
MRKTIFYFVLGLLGNVSCKSKVNTYRNDLGVDPATIAQMDSANYTTIEWKDTLYDFGTVHEGDSVVVRFRFNNSGSRALFITSAHSTCGCAAVQYPKEAILPGDKGEVVARFMNKYHPGPVRQLVAVTSNTRNGVNHQLSFIGQIADSSSSVR